MLELYLEVSVDDNGAIFIATESLISFFVYEYLKKPERVNVILVRRPSNYRKLLMLDTNLKQDCHRIVEYDDLSDEVKDFKLPIFRKDNTYIAGMCAVCREIIKSDETGEFHFLLGFKGSCLLSPAEHSVWTRYCELEIVEALRELWNYDLTYLDDYDEFNLPEVLCKFESHLGQPIRVHNIKKVIQDEVAKKSIGDNEILSHEDMKRELAFTRFAEGYWMTLADVILFAGFSLIFEKIPNYGSLETILPLTTKWYKKLCADEHNLLQKFSSLHLYRLDTSPDNLKNIILKKSETQNHSLYKSDPKRYKPKNRIFTRQEDLCSALEKVQLLNESITSKTENKFEDTEFDWSSVNLEAKPECGNLPDSRMSRKKQQLENLANVIVQLAEPGYRIVDFCCGSGHLGLILASKLPECHIIFLENKERSLHHAKERVVSMNLANVSFYQCNLDYFEGKFDIGTSLHACGTATDIVLLKCLNAKSKFVCCPCCYGNICPMPHLRYPLSEKYDNILCQKDYLHIAHCADQFHDTNSNVCNVEKSIQGEFCMDVIDTDRKFWAEQHGYSVILTRLKPENCSLKNRLLIGMLN